MDMGKVVLDDRVADDTGLASLYNVHLTLTRPDAAIAKALAAWSFADRRDGLDWHGQVPGPDRLRFLGMISRYVGLVARIEMAEIPDDLVLQ